MADATQGTPITYADGRYTVPDVPVLPFHRGGRHGPRHPGRRRGRCSTPRWRRSPAGSGAWCGREYSPGKAFNATGNWLPDATIDDIKRLPGGDQGTAHDARGRRHPLPQRGAAPGPRPVRVRAAGALTIAGVPSPGEAPARTSTSIIFRENTEDVYAGIEWQGGHAARPSGCIDFLNERSWERSRSARTPASASSRCRSSAPSGSSAAPSRYALDNGREVGDPGAQGQHP